MINEVNIEHNTFVSDILRNPDRIMSAGGSNINVSMVFHGDDIAIALQEASLMTEHAGILHLADAIARRDGIGSHSPILRRRPTLIREQIPEPAPTPPAPTQRQPTGKRNINLD